MSDFSNEYQEEWDIIHERNERALIPYDTIFDKYDYFLLNVWYVYLLKKVFDSYIYKHTLPLKEIIRIPDKMYTGNLVSTGKIDEYEKQYVEHYDFHFFKYSIGISEIMNDKIKVETVNISCKLNHLHPIDERPLVRDVFPRTSFVDKNYKGTIKLYLTGGGGIKADYKYEGEKGDFDADAEFRTNGSADFILEYTPKVAAISGYGNGSEVNFTFNRAQNQKDMPYPTGALEIFVVFMRPRSVSEIYVKTSLTINNHPIPIEEISRLVYVESDPSKSSSEGVLKSVVNKLLGREG